MTRAEVAATLATQESVDPLVVDLARALSLATRIETELVRLMRLSLFPQSDVGLEANLWFSPLVDQRDVLGLSLVAECRDELRHQLALPRHRSTLQTAWDVIERCHHPNDDPGIAPVINLQEAVTYHALASASPTEWSEHRRAMQGELGTLINALDGDSDGSLAKWIASALPALPDAARQSPAAIALAEKLRAADPTLVVKGVPRAAVSVSAQGLQWPEGGTAVGVCRRTNGIEFQVPPPEGRDWQRIHLPDTSPLSLQLMTPLRDGWRTEAVALDASSHVVADPTPASRCRIITVTGQRIAVQPAFAGQPTLAVFGLRGPDDSRRGDIATVAGDLGWQLLTDAQISDGTPADAVLDVGGLSPLLEYLKRAAHGPVVLALMPDGVAPHGSSEPVLDVTHGQTVFSAKFSPDGSRIVTAGSDGAIVWDAATGDRRVTADIDDMSRAAAFSFDGERLAIGANDGRLRLVTAASGASIDSVEAHDDWVMSVEFSRNGRRLVTASRDQTVALWNVGESLQKTLVLDHGVAVYHASFNREGSQLTTAAADGTVAVIDVQTGRRLRRLQHEGEIRSAVWSADGRSILTAGVAGRAFIWNVATGEREPLPFEHRDEIHFATFSPDGRRIAAAIGDGTASVWHVPSRALISAPLRHAAPTEQGRPRGRAVRTRETRGVYSVAFSPDGTRLLTGAADGRALMWDLLRPSREGNQFPSIAIPGDAPWLLGPDLDKRLSPDRFSAAQMQSLRAQLLALDEGRLLEWTARNISSPDADDIAGSADRLPVEPPAERGAKAMVAMVVEGIDILHETFLDERGQSRIVGIWNQRNTTGSPPSGFAYGTYHSAADIADYLETGSLPSGLDRNADGIGTHCSSIAAGRPVQGFAGGVAPEARILVVIVNSGEAATGYSQAHVDALQFIDQQAQSLGLPVVVHVTQGMNAGAHDGTSPLETAFDAFSRQGRAPGRVIVKPAGNEAGRGTHAELSPAADHLLELSWTSEAQERPFFGMVRIELWWAASNKYRFQLVSPGGDATGWIDLEKPELKGKLGKDQYFVELVARHVDNGDSRLLLEIGRVTGRVTPGDWSLRIHGVEIFTDGPIHAWIERSLVPTRFLSFVSEGTTLTIPATAHSVIAAGAVNADGLQPASFSSFGPTRDGRRKPEVAAAGIDIEGARAGTATDIKRMSGTSVAAAHLSGVVALVLSQAATADRPWPNVNQIRAALQQTARNYSGVWNPRTGYGVVDAEAVLKAFAPPAP